MRGPIYVHGITVTLAAAAQAGLPNGNNESHSGNTNIDWHKAYTPTYIPKGYEISNSINSDSLKEIEFKNSQDSLITYMELGEGNKPALDTENASVFESVNINGHEGTVVVKDSLATIIWEANDHMLMIRGQIEKDTVIKMAEGVKYID